MIEAKKITFGRSVFYVEKAGLHTYCGVLVDTIYECPFYECFAREEKVYSRAGRVLRNLERHRCRLQDMSIGTDSGHKLWMKCPGEKVVIDEQT